MTIWNKLGEAWSGVKVAGKKLNPYNRFNAIEEDTSIEEVDPKDVSQYIQDEINLSLKRQAQLDKYKAILPYLNENTQFPHCNQYILHRPSACEYCDKHSNWQLERMHKKVLFTGEKTILNNWMECPADAIYEVTAKNNWPGNQPTNLKEEFFDMMDKAGPLPSSGMVASKGLKLK